MISRRYSELLPDYLAGDNIRRHSEILEAMDTSTDDKLSMLNIWNLLERPILIQKEQTSSYGGTLRIHINTPTPIKEIYVKGVYEGATVDEQTINYDEDDPTTTTTLNYNLSQKIFFNVHRISLPVYDVRVTTYNDRVYMKQWPENDTLKGNSADHDEFLDKIGTLLNIPRRKYSQYSKFSNLAKSIPPYMGKQLINDWNIPECTEDDYDYYMRLKEFVTNFGESDLLTLMGNILYSIAPEIIEWDTSRWYPVGIDALTIPLYMQQENYINYPLNNIVDLLEHFVPVTRELLPFVSTDYTFNRTSTSTVYPNYWVCEGTLLFHDLPVRDATLETRFEPFSEPFSKTVSSVTDVDGHYKVTTGGLFSEAIVVDFYITGLNTPSYATLHTSLYALPTSVFFMGLDAWNSKRWASSSLPVSSITPATSSNTDIVAGTGMLTYTPIVDLEIVDTSSYMVQASFHYTGNYQRVGLSTLIIDEEDSTAEINEGVLLTPYHYLGESLIGTTHTLTARFLDGVMYLYLDGDYTGQHYDYSSVSSGMVYYVMQDSITTSADKLYTGSGSVDNDAGISTAPSGGYTVLSDETYDITDGFSLSNWTGRGARSITNENTLFLEYNDNDNNSNHYYDTGLPDTDWEIHINADFDTTNNINIWYSNTVDGSLTLTQTSTSTMIQERTLVNGSQQITNTTTLDNVTSSTNTTNNITIRREGTSIFFEYRSNDTGNLVSYEREYTGLDVNGNLVIQTNDGASVELSSLTIIGEGAMSNMIDLPTYNEENWSFISRGEGSTNPSLNDDTTIQMGLYNHHIWKAPLNTNKLYYVYFYKETQYYDLTIGVCNSNDSLPTRAPGRTINQSNSGVTSQSINKVKIYYDNTVSEWFLMVNDDPQYTTELLDGNGNRYIDIMTTSTNTASQNKILAITEEDAGEE